MTYPRVEIGKLCLPTDQIDQTLVPDSSFQYIDIASVDKDLKTIVRTQEILGRDAPSRARKVVRLEDVLISTVRPNLNAVATVPPELDGQVASTGFCVLRANPVLLNPRYLFYRALTPDFVGFLISRMRGANYPAVTDAVVKAATIPVPPRSEQNVIVEILDQADALRKKRAEADAKAERILPALFYKMFGDPATNPMAWPEENMGTVISETQYGTSTRANSSREGIPVLRMNNIDSAGRLNLNDLKYVSLPGSEISKYLLKPGDLLFNRTNSRELVGKTGLWSERFAAVPASYLIRVRVQPEKVLPEYVWAYMNTSFIKQVLFDKARRAIGMANINAQELRALPIPVPDLDRQRKFALKTRELEHVKSSWIKAGNKIGALFAAILHRAFSGELTTKWREAHMNELISEMEDQAKSLGSVENSMKDAPSIRIEGTPACQGANIRHGAKAAVDKKMRRDTRRD